MDFLDYPLQQKHCISPSIVNSDISLIQDEHFSPWNPGKVDLQQLSQQISEGRWNHDTSIDANDMTGIATAVAAALGKLSGSWDSELREFCEPYFNGGW